MEGQVLEQVQQTRLLGVVLDERLSWQANTTFIVKKAYKRMSLLHKLYNFAVPEQELIEIYILYIRSVDLYTFPPQEQQEHHQSFVHFQ